MPIAFLDFEASSLGSGSFPIEVGWAVDGGEAETHLIQPAPGWTGWSAAAERLHGIPQARLLAEGEPHGDVARRVAEALGGTDMVVASDNPAFEQFWLERLMAAAWRPAPFAVLPAARLYATEAGRTISAGVTAEAVLAVVTGAMRAERTRQRVRHRAGPDAGAMLWILQEIRRRLAIGRPKRGDPPTAHTGRSASRLPA